MNAIATTPGSVFDSDQFFMRVRSATTRVLMLDYDGVLAPFHADPMQAIPYAGVLPTLDAIMDAGHTRLVVASGRWTKDLLPLLKLKRLPEIWGSSGWERRYPSGEYQSRQISAAALQLLVTVDEWTRELESAGARVEHKPGSIAFHWRGQANHNIAEIRGRLLEKWIQLGRFQELVWHDFDNGIELRAHDCDKGDVVRTLAAETGPDAAYAYLGDDLPDEDAFRAIPDQGVSVLVRSQFRPTVADLWIHPPQGVLQFLARWHEAASG